ncbi:hypothetical protein [Nocardiopsis salina]|uniref:hypothetical protein n=1 Tax=Nocardiopsis salina TaxID=245836 RepID=UPI00047648B3|nr:hypothetical protein [Nocardiopsis salina]
MAGPTSGLTETDPTQLGGYRLEGRLDTSSLGVVYLGRDNTGAPVDVAVLNAGAGIDPGSRRRFVDAVAGGEDVLSARTRGRAPLWVAVAHDEEGHGAGEYLRKAGQGGPVMAAGPVVMPHWAGERSGAVRWTAWDGRRGSSAAAGPGNWGLILALALLLLFLLLVITLLYWWMLQFPQPDMSMDGSPDMESGPPEDPGEDASPSPGEEGEPEGGDEGDEEVPAPTTGEEEGDDWGDRPEDNL